MPTRPRSLIAVLLLLLLPLRGSEDAGAERAEAELWPTPRPAGNEAPSPLAHRELLLEGILHNLDGDFDAADAVWDLLGERDPTHPAAPVFRVNTLYWRQIFDEDDTHWDDAIRAGCADAIEKSRARLDADSDDPEGHFYMGQALMQRGRLRGVRGSYVSAGSDGEAARKHLERVNELVPELVDARFQLGLYYYYASRIPRMVTSLLGWLWFVPSGDGPTGLRYLDEVVRRGDLYRDEATLILGNVYTYHEPQHIGRALRLISALHARHPYNSLIHFELIEIHFEARDYAAAVRLARELEARPPRHELDRGRGLMARIWRARAELQLDRAEAALETLAEFGPGGPERPYWGSAWVHLTRGRSYDVLERRPEAVAEYEQVLSLKEPRASRRAAELAQSALDRPFTLSPSLTATP